MWDFVFFFIYFFPCGVILILVKEFDLVTSFGKINVK